MSQAAGADLRIAPIRARAETGLPLALLFGFGMHRGAVGLWWGLSAGLGVVALALTARFLRISSRRIEAV